MFAPTRNYLLTRDDVGKARPITRDLPPRDFSYGRKIKMDQFNACKLQYNYNSS